MFIGFLSFDYDLQCHERIKLSFSSYIFDNRIRNVILILFYSIALEVPSQKSEKIISETTIPKSECSQVITLVNAYHLGITMWTW